LRKSTTSTSSALASSTPATSTKRVFTSPSATIIALFCPKASTFPPGLPMRRKRTLQIMSMKARGSIQLRRKEMMVLPSRAMDAYTTPFSSRRAVKVGSYTGTVL
jgi:hypothetical protein